jgi:hypothetical protein
VNHGFQSLLICANPVVAGFLVLHFATRKDSEEAGKIDLRWAMRIVVSGLLLIAVPLVIWSATLHGRGPQVTPGGVLSLAGYLDVVFLWLIWNVSAYALRIPGLQDTRWDTNWGASYSPELKRRMLGPMLAQMDKEGKIGDLVVDIGSGAAPVSKLLPSTAERKLILIDIAAKNQASPDSQFLRLDAENIAQPDSLSYKKALVRVCRFLAMDARSPVRAERATTLVFSDILNYVDYRHVLGGFAGFLKPEGRIIIVNLPSRGIREEFSEKGLKRNDDLCAFLGDQNFSVEYKDFPCRPKDATDESEELIVLVARKPISPRNTPPAGCGGRGRRC